MPFLAYFLGRTDFCTKNPGRRAARKVGTKPATHQEPNTRKERGDEENRAKYDTRRPPTAYHAQGKGWQSLVRLILPPTMSLSRTTKGGREWVP